MRSREWLGPVSKLPERRSSIGERPGSHRGRPRTLIVAYVQGRKQAMTNRVFRPACDGRNAEYYEEEAAGDDSELGIGMFSSVRFRPALRW